jgi:hypothetical protein
MCSEHIRSTGQGRPRPPSSPFGSGPRLGKGDHVPPPPHSAAARGIVAGETTSPPSRPPPRGGWSRPSDDVGRGGPSRARARRRRRIPPPGGGHGQATTSDAAGPAGPARAAGGGGRGAERRLEGDREIRPGPPGPGCGAARGGPRAGENPGGGAARSRSGAETGRPAGRPQKANPYSYRRDKELTVRKASKTTRLAPSAALNAESPATWRGMARLPPSEGGPAGCHQAVRAVTARGPGLAGRLGGRGRRDHGTAHQPAVAAR